LTHKVGDGRGLFVGKNLLDRSEVIPPRLARMIVLLGDELFFRRDGRVTGENAAQLKCCILAEGANGSRFTLFLINVEMKSSYYLISSAIREE
jgi:hypothetical protein